MTARSGLGPVWVAGAAFLPTLVTGCSIPARPPWWPQRKHAPTVSPTVSVPAVRNPWHPGMRQLGIQVYWTANRNDSSDAVVRAKAQRIIDYAISLNANSVAVTFPFFTSGLPSDTVYAKPKVTPSPGHIAIFLAAAAHPRIRVTLRPVLDDDALLAQNPTAWPRPIEPRDLSA